MAKTGLIKVQKALLGMATEIAVTAFIMAVAWGLCWLITQR